MCWRRAGNLRRLGYQYSLTYFEHAPATRATTRTINTRGLALRRERFMATHRSGSRYDYATTCSSIWSVRARIGINGLVTCRLLSSEWSAGASFTKDYRAPAIKRVIAQAEPGRYITPNRGRPRVSGSLCVGAVGYSRDFFGSYLGDYYTRDRGD
jgi:hypothetical protein